MNPNPIEDWLNQPDGIAARLRQMRTDARITGKDLAAAAGWQPPKVSKIENGRQTPTAEDIETWGRICGAPPEAVHDLLTMLKAATEARRGWRQRMRRGQAAIQAGYTKLTAESARIRYFETIWMPGLLQTPDYARAVLLESAELHDADVDDVDAAVAERMRRQQFLYDTGKSFEFLLWEPVLRDQVYPPQVVRGQLDRLLVVAGLPNVRLGVLPFGTRAGFTRQNSFRLYDDIAVTESFVEPAVYREDQAETLVRALESWWPAAAEGDEARLLIVEAARQLEAAG